MGEQAFRTVSSEHDSIEIANEVELTESTFLISTDDYADTDTKIPTAKTSQDKIDTISSSAGFEQKHWGKVKTVNSVDYIGFGLHSSQAEGRETYVTSCQGNDFHYTNPRFYPFNMTKELTLRGINWRNGAVADTGPVWVCFWENTNSLTNVSNGPGNLVAYIKLHLSSGTFGGTNASITFVDDGDDGFVFDSSHNNTQATLPVGKYWVSIHAQNNDAGTNSYSIFWCHQNNKQKLYYGGGGVGHTVGFKSSSFGPNIYGLYYNSSSNSPDSDSWTPPSNFISSVSSLREESNKGPYAISILML